MARLSVSEAQEEDLKSPGVCQQEFPIILMADDDFEDRLLVKKALGKLKNCEAHFVEDGEKLLDYLNRRRDYTNPELAPRPALILLDLNMPKKPGLEALAEIKAAPGLQAIPVIIFTTSNREDHMNACRNAGANGYMIKPCSFAHLVETLGQLVRWLG